MPGNTLNSDRGLQEIKRVNSVLRRLAGGHMGPSEDELDAVYRIELMQECREHAYNKTVHHMRLIRQERSIRQKSDPTVQSTVGGQEIISDYEITIFDGVCTGSINTYRGLDVYNLHRRYENRGFAALLAHVLVYCCACARLKLEIVAIHSATMHLYRKYADFASDVSEIDDKDRITSGFSVVSKTKDAGHKKDEKSAGHKKDEKSVEKVITCIALSIDASQNGLHADKVALLEKFAMEKTNEVLNRLRENRNTHLNANVCAPDHNTYIV